MPVPGVLDALKAARISHVTVIFNSNHSAANADATAAALDKLIAVSNDID